MSIDLITLRDQLISAAYEAGAAIMSVYRSDFTTARKADHSPVTQADVIAEKLILARLQQYAPDIPVIAEEQAAANGVPQQIAQRFFLIDPLDGTREFIARNDEFTVNIALVENGKPILGVVYLPAFDEIYAGYGHDAIRRKNDKVEAISARFLPATGAIMTISRSHAVKEMVKAEDLDEPVTGSIVAGSSLKFCRVAEGNADLYPRFGPTMEWDTAAGHAVLTAAGGSVTTLDGATLQYGKAGLRNPAFIARGRR